ncbi:MAG: zinc ribbon domain-containing protein [Prevotellaceae bacterium]|nr:zinc ribbon domain-containing protein [Prevotellaceae bacterium]
MKCAKCGHDFGHGETCAHCGAERIVGLANYNGYAAPASGSAPAAANDYADLAPASQPLAAAPDSMICYACSEIIPSDSKFCPCCGQELWTACPQCHHVYSSQYTRCNQCGTSLQEYREAEERKRLAEEQARLAEEERRNEEQRRHEAWLASPEGQAEMKRREEEKIKQEYEKKCREEAEKIRIEIEDSYAKDWSNWFVVAMGFYAVVVLLCTLVSEYAAFALLPIIIIGIVVGCAIYSPERQIEKWKKKNPNHRATPYL